MTKPKTTGKKAATAASKTIKSPSTSVKAKAAAGSALSQVKTPKKSTSSKAATAASKVLTDGRSSSTSKSAAASALSQRTIKSPAKSGTIAKSTVARAVKAVSSKYKK